MMKADAMADHELTLFDRLEAIKTTIKSYGEEKFYLSFSGGKDSMALSSLIDEAVPGNRIPRVYFDTGIEYQAMVEHVKGLAASDDRIVIYNSGVNVKKMLEADGYPFKSKEFSRNAFTYDRSGMTATVKYYVDGLRHDGKPSDFKCPKSLKYVFSEERKQRLKISHKCCTKLKKDTAKRYVRESGKVISILGVRQAENGVRRFHSGCVQFKNDALVSFKPLNPVGDDFIDWYIESRGIKLCSLYYPPISFERTGCKGCPFARDIKKELDTMRKYMPAERRQCEVIWGPVYDEYRRIGYRRMREERE